MRTAGQGQAAVPRERVYRRRSLFAVCLDRDSWAVGEDPTDCHKFCGALSRGIFLDRSWCPGWGKAFGLPWARSAFMAFSLRDLGCAGPKDFNLEGRI